MTDRVFHVTNRFIDGDDVRELEERGLKYRVDPVSEADAFRDFNAVDDVETNLFFGKRALESGRKIGLKLGDGLPLGVQKEGSAFLDACRDIVEGNVFLLVAGDEIGLVDEIRRFDRLLSETEVRDRDAARLLRVIREVPLSVHVRFVADDLDGVLVCADGAVGAESPELAADRSGWSRDDLLRGRKRRIGDVVHDADGEMVLRLEGLEVVEDGLDLVRGRILRTEAVSSADDDGCVRLIVEERLDVFIHRFSEGARLLASVEHRDRLNRGRESAEEELLREGPVEMDFDESDRFTSVVEVVDDLFGALAYGSHGDDDPVRIRGSVVVERMILASRELFDLGHILFDDVGDDGVEAICCFLGLEENIRILRGPLLIGVLRIHRLGLEAGDRVEIDEFCKILEVKNLNFLDLMRRPESVEEVQEGDACLNRGKVRDGRKIHRFLDAAGREHCESGTPARHNVAVVAENRKRMAGDGARGYVKDAGKKLSGHLVHIGNHEQKPLRCRVGGRKRSGGQCAVHCAGGSRFGLKLGDSDRFAENILEPVRSPFIDIFRHR